MEKIIGITEARTNIKNLVDKVSEQNETYILKVELESFSWS